MPPSSHIYRVSASDASFPLRQCEFLSDVVHTHLDLNPLIGGRIEVQEKVYPYAVILTQDCDLTQDFDARRAVVGEPNPTKRDALSRSDKIIPSVLLCQVLAAQEQRGADKITSDIWTRIRQNKDERYHFLQAVDASCDPRQEDLPELAIDFKRYFTVPTDELYWRIDAGQTRRRCLMASPYLEHLSTRFAYFLSRVALPEDHFSEPGAGKVV